MAQGLRVMNAAPHGLPSVRGESRSHLLGSYVSSSQLRTCGRKGLWPVCATTGREQVQQIAIEPPTTVGGSGA